MSHAFAAARIVSDYFDNARMSRNWKPLRGDYPNPFIAGLSRYHYSVIATEGDGACALHSVFGRPCADRNNHVYAANARGMLVDAFGATAAVFRNRLQNDVLYSSVTSALWRDGVLPSLLQSLDASSRQGTTSAGEIPWELVSFANLLRKRLVSYCQEQVERDARNAKQSVCIRKL